ncbi:hypothetical protein A1O3_05991 [Capronia epimyces CBS 606.96]|uniref:Mur ligase C-terminal domain-containing protein n=1 Tax=Capronia epimyces CBS 606.96 TaxID=1182542 RepID=W9Y7U1_9EURO|nr:uncharacterized protein A1O3_05991 [Capronia epimyces CBS 606.96]EXJ85316.1 hypothetical protein A1O3_05991 [Capronia epimyces CBS 606.96]
MINLGLQRISRLLAPLFAQHPTLPWKAVHIAGTNGKGSVAALVATFLSAAGYRVGRFTSPHLVDRWDCITLDQRAVERDKFLSVEQRLKAAIGGRSAVDSDDGDGDGNGNGNGVVNNDDAPSEFEILTATAFELFTAEGVDVAVIECGLGGRLDATNVLRSHDVIVSVLTKVGLDHTEFLGSTLEAVAAEKSGIFKNGVPVVVDESNAPAVLEVVSQKLKALAAAEGGGVLESGPFVLPQQQRDRLLQNQDIAHMGLARHQCQNLMTAFTAYYLAEEQLVKPQAEVPGTATGTSTSPATLSRTRFAQHIATTTQYLPSLIWTAQSSLRGRLEWLYLPSSVFTSRIPGIETVKVLLDGAHNPQSAQALAEYIASHVRDHSSSAGPVTWVLAAKQDKDIRTMLSLLLQPSDNVVTCSFGPVDGMPWVKSMDASELAGTVREFTTGTVEVGLGGSVQKAVQRAIEIAYVPEAGAPYETGTGTRPLCIAGSLYLVGDVLRWLKELEE